MQTPIDLLSLAGQPREAVTAVLPLDEDDGAAWGPFHEFVAYFGEDCRLIGGHVFFNELQTPDSAHAMITNELNIRPGDQCAVQLHPCVRRPEIITATFRFTV
ncbi:hypothetical protein [Verrucomicrobium spinosum]|uniref:hypothetical protein n=1 Tax=Verrucomicrobium spinosum TaxID=2736 RepID=UPI0001744C08|nr:hypothetical protein [Verrucomicrobium spinosum]